MESTVQIQPRHRLSPEEFYDFCVANPDGRFEQAADGEIIIVPPAGSDSSSSSLEVSAQLWDWARRTGHGKAYESSAGFVLPNGAVRAPDAAWVSKSQLATLTAKSREAFFKLCPEFVVEVQSQSDSLPALRNKMREWMENGAELAWLIQPKAKKITVYRPNSQPEIFTAVDSIAGEGPVAGFVLDLRGIWEGL